MSEDPLETRGDPWFETMSAAHRFIVAVRASPAGANVTLVRAFASALRHIPPPIVEGVLLKIILSVGQSVGGLGGVLEAYKEAEERLHDPLARFVSVFEQSVLLEADRSRAVRATLNILSADFRNRGLSLASVAARVGTNPRSLGHQIRMATGITFRQILRRHRMDAAALQLQDLAVSIKSVWIDLGYTSAADFNHDFVREFGLSPTAYRKTIRSAAAAQSQMDEGRPSVLLVDDDESTTATMGVFFALDGWRVEQVPSAARAAGTCAHAGPTVAIIDFRLPDRDGIACLRDLRKGGWRGPAVMLTADWTIYDRAADIALLGAIIRSKPMDADELVLLARRLVQAPSPTGTAPYAETH